MRMPPILADCIRLAVAYAENAAVRQAAQASRRLTYVTALTVAAVVTGIASATCALAALWVVLLPFCGPAGAPLIVSGVLCAGCATLVGLLRRGPRPPEATSGGPNGRSAVPMLIGAVLAGLAMGSASE